MKENKRIKVRVILDSKNKPFAEVLPVGFETELITYVSDKDEVITKEVRNIKTDEIVYPKTVRLAGTYIGYAVVGANGEEYGEGWISKIIGNRPMNEIFEKVVNSESVNQ